MTSHSVQAMDSWTAHGQALTFAADVELVLDNHKLPLKSSSFNLTLFLLGFTVSYSKFKSSLEKKLKIETDSLTFCYTTKNDQVTNCFRITQKPCHKNKKKSMKYERPFSKSRSFEIEICINPTNLGSPRTSVVPASLNFELHGTYSNFSSITTDGLYCCNTQRIQNDADPTGSNLIFNISSYYLKHIDKFSNSKYLMPNDYFSFYVGALNGLYLNKVDVEVKFSSDSRDMLAIDGLLILDKRVECFWHEVKVRAHHSPITISSKCQTSNSGLNVHPSSRNVSVFVLGSNTINDNPVHLTRTKKSESDVSRDSSYTSDDNRKPSTNMKKSDSDVSLDNSYTPNDNRSPLTRTERSESDVSHDSSYTSDANRGPLSRTKRSVSRERTNVRNRKATAKSNQRRLASRSWQRRYRKWNKEAGVRLGQQQHQQQKVSPAGVRGAVAAGDVFNRLMYAQMGFHMLGYILNADFAGTAINRVFILGSFALRRVADRVAAAAVKLSTTYPLWSRALAVTAPFLAQLTVGYIILELCHEAFALAAGEKDALVNVVGYSVAITVQLVSISLQVMANLGVASVVSIAAYSNPLGVILATTIFAGVNIYRSVKNVAKMMHTMHMTLAERFQEGFFDFIRSGTLTYFKMLLMQKRLNDQLVDDMRRHLNNMTRVRFYTAPMLRGVRKCGNETVHERNGFIFFFIVPIKIGAGGGWIKKLKEVCRYHTVPVENNHGDLQSEPMLRYSRTWPYEPLSTRLVCAEGNLFKGDNEIGRNVSHCDGMISVEDLSEKAYPLNAQISLIVTGHGVDTVIGVIDFKNLFIVGSGKKTLIGGRLSDTFVLETNLPVSGLLDGQEGNNSLVLTDYALDYEVAIVEKGDSTAQMFTFANRTYAELMLDDIGHIVGRTNVQDTISVHSRLAFLDLAGGGEHFYESDRVTIKDVPQPGSLYNLLVVLRPHTIIENLARSGAFVYRVDDADDNAPPTLGHVEVHLQSSNTSTATHVLAINLPLERVSAVLVSKTQDSAKEDDVTLDLRLNNLNNRFPVRVSGWPSNASLVTKDGYLMYTRSTALFVLHHTSNRSRQLTEAQQLSLRLSANVIVRVSSGKEGEQFVFVGAPALARPQSYSNNDASSPSPPLINLLVNKPKSVSYLRGGDEAENLFNVTALCTFNSTNETNGFKCRMKNVNLYPFTNSRGQKQSIDLRSIRNMHDEAGFRLRVTAHRSQVAGGAEVFLQLTSVELANQSNVIPFGRITFKYVRLNKNSYQGHWYRHFLIHETLLTARQLNVKPFGLVPTPIDLPTDAPSVVAVMPEEAQLGLHFKINKSLGRNNKSAAVDNQRLIFVKKNNSLFVIENDSYDNLTHSYYNDDDGDADDSLSLSDDELYDSDSGDDDGGDEKFQDDTTISFVFWDFFRLKNHYTDVVFEYNNETLVLMDEYYKVTGGHDYGNYDEEDYGHLLS